MGFVASVENCRERAGDLRVIILTTFYDREIHIIQCICRAVRRIEVVQKIIIVWLSVRSMDG